MNRTQVIVPLIVIAVAAVTTSAIKGWKQRQSFLISQTVMIGQDLINATNSAKIVRIGDGLSGQLSLLLAYPTSIENYKTGDASGPIGNGSADSVLLLSNTVGKRLGIRLRCDSNSERFHVLGWWNLNPADHFQ